MAGHVEPTAIANIQEHNTEEEEDSELLSSQLPDHTTDSNSSDHVTTMSEQEMDPLHSGGTEMEPGLSNTLLLKQVSFLEEVKALQPPSSDSIRHRRQSPPQKIALDNKWDDSQNTPTNNTPVGEPPVTVLDGASGPQRRVAFSSAHGRTQAEVVPALDVHLQPFQTVKECVSKRISAINLMMLLGIMLLVQLCLVFWHTYASFLQESNQPKCKNYLFQMLPITMLRLLSRIILPGAVYLYIYRYVISNPECKLLDDFILLLLKPRNRYFATEFMKRFIDAHSDDEAGTEHHLKGIQKSLDKRLQQGAIMSVSGAVLLVLALMFYVVPGGSDSSLIGFLVRFLDVLSFGCLQAMCGMLFSLIFVNGVIKQYLLQFRGFCNCKKLKQKAQSVDNLIVQQWYPLNKLVSFLTVMYCITLLISWASGIPLTCGISLSGDTVADKTSLSAYWLFFTLAIGLGQFFGICPYSFYFGCCAFAIEAVVLVILYFSVETFEWAEFVHLLYAIIPLTYLLWYHILSIPRQWAGTRIAPNPRSQSEKPELYWVRFVSRSAMVVLIALSLAASMWTEYEHVKKSSSEYGSTAIMVAPSSSAFYSSALESYSEDEVAVIQDYIRSNCLVHPKSLTSTYMSHHSCLYLDPAWARDKATRRMILKTIDVIKAMWSVMDNVQLLEEE